MGIQASVNRGMAPVPTDASFQAGHLGLLNMAAFLPGVRSLHLGTPPLQSCLQKGQLDFWATMQNDAKTLPSMMFDIGDLVPRMSQPIAPFDMDQWDLCKLLSDPEEGEDCHSFLSVVTPPTSRVGSPLGQFEVPGDDSDATVASKNATYRSNIVPGSPTALPSDEETLKRVLPDPRSAERLEKRARINDALEAMGLLEKAVKTEEKASEKAARRKRKRTPESLERGRAESARARARRKVRYQKIKQEVQDRTQRAAALQFHLHSLQMEALHLRTLLFTNFGISVLPGSVPLLASCTGDADPTSQQPPLRNIALRPDSTVATEHGAE